MPQSKWSNKDERQYEHIKRSEERRGASTKRAKSIAAASVNKERRQEGRTPNRKTQGQGNPNRSLENRSRDELYNKARELDIARRSKMNKQELVEAIRARQ